MEADIIKVFLKNKNINVSSWKEAFFTGRVPNDRHCTGFSIKSLSY